MLRIGICDDVYDARLVLRAALERAAEKRRITAAFFEFSAGENLLRWLESHAGELDLVFLDLEMGEVDGIETARRLRAADEGLQIVFVTGHADRVFDGYGVGALGYLLKPPAPEALEEMLDRAGAALCRALERAYVCRSGEVYYRIPLQKILYFSSDRRQVTCVTADRSYTFYLRQAGRRGRPAGAGFCAGAPAVSGAGGGGGAAGRRGGVSRRRRFAAGEPLLPAGGAAGHGPGGTGGLTRWMNCF